MPFYQSKGKTPPKRHTVFKYKKKLCYEELVSREGFSSMYSNLYHLHMPTSISKVGNFTKNILSVESTKHQAYHLETLNIKSSENVVDSRVPLFFNDDIIINSIDPKKDVDGFHPYNLGCLISGKSGFVPCTPKGIMRILDYYDIDLSNKHVVVVGRSNIVGRPISILTSMKKKFSNATTTLCHSGTKNITQYTQNADVVILALGSPEYLSDKDVKEGTVIIDVGINRIKDSTEKGFKLVGDADYESMIDHAGAITPVPGGVGPMTIAMLVENTVEAAEKSINSSL